MKQQKKTGKSLEADWDKSAVKAICGYLESRGEAHRVARLDPRQTSLYGQGHEQEIQDNNRKSGVK